MIKLLAGLFFLGAKQHNQNKALRKTADICASIEKLSHFQPEDPLPEGIVDVESWYQDIKDHSRWDVIDWYRWGKYKKKLPKPPIGRVWDWNRYYADCEKYKDEPIVCGVPKTVNRRLEGGLYEHFWPEDSEGNFLKEWPDKEEWELQKLRQLEKWRVDYDQKRLARDAWEKEKYGK